jgi:tetratricopeptide (TPR) repeat protein
MNALRIRRSVVVALALAMSLPAAAQSGRAGGATISLVIPDTLPAAVRSRLVSALQDARAHPRDAAATGRLAMLLHAFQQYRLAADCYEIAGQLEREAFAWPYLSGVALAELGEARKAADRFRRALVIDPSSVPARVRLADALLADGDPGGSRELHAALVEDFPELALAHYGLGRALAELGDRAAALVHYERAVALAPQFGRAHYALALASRDAGLGDQAARHLALYREFGARRPSLMDPLLEEIRSSAGTSRDMIARAARLASAGQVEEAIALHLKALDTDASAAQAHVNLIALYGRTGRPDDAERHYRAALRLGSSLADAHYNYGVLQASLDRPAEAVESFRHALEADPFHSRAHNNLAALFARQGRREEAVAHYRQALASAPQHQAARLGLGQLLLSLMRPREAVEQFEILVRLGGPDVARHRHALATAWFAAGDPEKAIACAQDALRDAAARGQTGLAGRIDRDLQRMKAARR